ncbi:hypothetical protein [Microvirga sp. P5_D2]
MITWATVIALAAGALFYVSDNPSVVTSIAELAGVVAMFMLVCAAEVYSEPKG